MHLALQDFGTFCLDTAVIPLFTAAGGWHLDCFVVFRGNKGYDQNAVKQRMATGQNCSLAEGEKTWNR